MKKILIIALLAICMGMSQNNDCSGVLPFEWVTVPAGSFEYGRGNIIINIDYDFQIMKYEVTNIQFAHFLNEAFSDSSIWLENGDVYGYYADDERVPDDDYLYIKLSAPECYIKWQNNSILIEKGYECFPVVEVTWIGAWAMAIHYGYRLPTEIEWEKAARGNEGWKYPWGKNELNCELANYFGCYDSPIPVGQTKGKSIYDAYDMSGNVWEWTDTYWNDLAPHRVLRGGSWFFDANYLMVWYQYAKDPTQSDIDTGFRLAK